VLFLREGAIGIDTTCAFCEDDWMISRGVTRSSYSAHLEYQAISGS